MLRYYNTTCLTYVSVSEPIALELRQSTGNIYLHAQIFAGSMYIGGALCMFFLRAWKIGQLELVAAELNKAPSELGVLSTQPCEVGLVPSSGWLSHVPSIVKRMVELRRV